jgi:hypothetical protein
MTGRLKPYESRMPSRLEMAVSLGVVLIVTILGVLILLGAFAIHPSFKVTLGIILIGYGLIRLWMIKSRYRSLRRKEEGGFKPPKEDEKNLRNF